MAGNNPNHPSSSFGKDELDESNTVTMLDVLEAEEILEEDADAVLGAGDDKNCTYSEGYLKRQALYACITCLPGDIKGERAGICLACSYHCHADHNLLELYTKRNFRCDCGNSIFKGASCSLDPVKSAVNEENRYNDNFRGFYCSCKRPYPDPENDNDDDVMMQCIVCEDWFHSKHLGSSVPAEEDYCEMICSSCTDRLEFLHYYLEHSMSKVLKTDKNDESVASVDVTDESDLFILIEEQVNASTGSMMKALPNSAADVEEAAKNNDSLKEIKTVEEAKCELTSTEHPEEEKCDNVISSSSKLCEKVATDKKDCLLKNLKKLSRGSGATFWPDGFRKLLCACTSCLEIYKSNNVMFLIDEEDTVKAYEEKGKNREKAVGTETGTTQYERGMEALSSLDRVKQMEAILSYNEMKSHLSEYLAKFVENKKVVREEDIREFFSEMQARKRQKLEMPHYCR